MFKILIVDDTRSVHAFVKALFGEWKYMAFSDVYDGSEAVALLSAGAEFNLILLDWEMPQLNGPATFEEFKRLGFRVPVIMMTTKNQPSDIAMMLQAGVAEYLMKPFTLDILLEKIESVSGRNVAYVI